MAKQFRWFFKHRHIGGGITMKFIGLLVISTICYSQDMITGGNAPQFTIGTQILTTRSVSQSTDPAITLPNNPNHSPSVGDLFNSNGTLNIGFYGLKFLNNPGNVSIWSGISGNSDLTGELSFSGTTTASYTFISTLYTSHPECTIEPQFDMGSGNRHWVTYTGTTSFTINFATSVTGPVTYNCTARN